MKLKSFLSHTAGSLSSSVRGYNHDLTWLSVRFSSFFAIRHCLALLKASFSLYGLFLHCSAWHGSQKCVRINQNDMILICFSWPSFHRQYKAVLLELM